MENSQIQQIEKKKRSLKRYKKNLSCIERLEAKLDLVSERMTSVKSPNFSGMPRGGTPVTTADLVCEKMELEERIERLKEKGKILRREILAEIDTLEDPRQAEVLEAFFIGGQSMEEISDDTTWNVRHVYRLYSEGVTILALSEDNIE